MVSGLGSRLLMKTEPPFGVMCLAGILQMWAWHTGTGAVSFAFSARLRLGPRCLFLDSCVRSPARPHLHFARHHHHPRFHYVRERCGVRLLLWAVGGVVLLSLLLCVDAAVPGPPFAGRLGVCGCLRFIWEQERAWRACGPGS